MAQDLDAAYRSTLANLPTNAAVRVESVAGRDTLTLTPLDKLDEPPSLLTLRQAVSALIPRVDLPEALLEIHARTGFADEFTHISEAAARVTTCRSPSVPSCWPKPAISAWGRWSAATSPP